MLNGLLDVPVLMSIPIVLALAGCVGAAETGPPSVEMTEIIVTSEAGQRLAPMDCKLSLSLLAVAALFQVTQF